MSDVRPAWSPAEAPTDAPGRAGSQRDLVAALWIGGVLAAVGAALGAVWAAWSPDGPAGFRRADGLTWAISESEASIAADGRYLVLTGLTGLIAAVLLWTRTKLRGPITVVALAVGCLAGSQLTRVVGRLLGGGSSTGQSCAIYLPQPVNGQCIRHLQLAVHLSALYFLSAVVAVLAYSVFASFAAHDDLGRPDPVRAALLRRREERQASVGDGIEP